MLKEIVSFWDRPHYNLIRSIVINFIALPIKQAIKLPIAVYGKYRFYNLDGKISILARPKFKMIKLGCNITQFSGNSEQGILTLLNGGNLVFKGNFISDLGTVIRVSGKLELGNETYIGAESKILCDNHIVVGDYTQLTFQNIIMDSNFHYIANFKDKIIHNCQREILIGHHCWFGNKCSIMPGCKISDYTIICSNSLLNKSYGDDAYTLLGGIPARKISDGKIRIWDQIIESKLRKHFMDSKTYNISLSEMEILKYMIFSSNTHDINSTKK